MNAQEFKKHFLPCHPRMFATALRLTHNRQAAEDLVQDTMLRLWTKRHRLVIPDNPEAFAVTSLRNLFYDGHRKKRLKENDEEPGDYQLRADKDPGFILEQKMMVSRVRQIIDTLPERQRLIITLRDLKNLSYEEIEAQTGLNPVNIRVALSRARKAVRDNF